MKQIIQTYTFLASAKTVTFTELDSISLERILLITNTTKNTIIYNFADSTKGGTVTGNILTLATSTTGMSDTDKLNIVYDEGSRDVTYEKSVVGTQRSFFKDGINTSVAQPDSSFWTTTSDSVTHIVNTGGSGNGSAYIRISLDPFLQDSGVTLTAKKQFTMPVRASFGVSSSTRSSQTEAFFGMVGCDVNGTIAYNSSLTDQTLPAQTVTIGSNVATITLVNHGLVANDVVSIFNVTGVSTSTFLNISAAAVTVTSKDTFTVGTGITTASVAITGGTLRILDPLYYAKNGIGYNFNSATTTTSNLVARRDGAKARRLSNQTVGTMTSVQTFSDAYSDAFESATNYELVLTNDESTFRSYSVSSTAGVTSHHKVTQQTPDDSVYYKPYIRARNLAGMSKPFARITSIAKSGTTTATITFDAAHGLLANDTFGLYGVLNGTDFPSSSTYAVASVTSSTVITAVIGATTPTTTSTGGFGYVINNNATNSSPIVNSIQSITRTSNVLSVVGVNTWSGVSVGDYVNLYGMTGTGASGYEGAYKILRLNGTTLELQSTGSDFTIIATGGGVLRRTDVRVHFVRMTDFTRNITEIYGGKGSTIDANNAISVVVASSIGATQSSGSNTTQWSAAGWGGFLVADVTSAAITTTTTSSTIVPGSLNNVGTYAHSFVVPVTAVSGTTPTMDVGIEESPDAGTTWVRIYDFPRITATGVYYSPQIPATWGTRYRYVRTVTGTTPSFTHAINRIQFSTNPLFLKQFIDRSIVATTLNSTTPTYVSDGCKNIQLTVYGGTITTSPATFIIEGSENGTDWYGTGGTGVTAGSGAVTNTFYANFVPKFVRAKVSVAGVGQSAYYLVIKALG